MTADAARWARVKAIFHEAVECDAETREALVADRCGADADLRRDVESLLAACDRAPEFLERPALAGVGPDDLPPCLPAGTRCGPYRLIEEIGHGGMGTVFLAERDDDQFERRVAIKIVRGWLVSSFLRGHFAHERRILAALDHPHIARLLDGGTTADGVPFLVMELVEGVPIDRYCDERALSVDARLRLLLDVCDAVEYAHRHFIVHRDLKAGNILVGADGSPKLLDFGIAKLLEPATGGPADRTATAAGMLTPEYASPEQVRGGAVTAATDVYSLGVLLFRLLAGAMPFERAGRDAHELSRAICEADPDRPSTAAARRGGSAALQRRIAGDLDAIVLKALAKQPFERYPSVEQFAGDLRRHLDGHPVLARRITIGYRSSRFVRRHRWRVAVAAAILLSLVGGLAATSWQARIARRERARAQERFEMVRKLADSMIAEFGDAVGTASSSIASRKRMVANAVEYLDALAQDAESDPALLRQLASAYLRIGELQGDPSKPNLGDVAGAIASYEHALGLYARLEKLDDSPRGRMGAAETRQAIGVHYWAQGRKDLALAQFEEVRRRYEQLSRSDPRNAAYRSGEAGAHYLIGQVWLRAGDAVRARDSYERSAEGYQTVLAAVPDNVMARRNLALAYMKLGDAASLPHDDTLALSWYRKAAASLEELGRSPSPPRDTPRMTAMAWLRVAEGLVSAEPGEAEQSVRRALAILQPVASADLSNMQARADLAYAFLTLGKALASGGHKRSEETALVAAIGELRHVLVSGPQNVDARTELAMSLRRLGDVHASRHDVPAAVRAYDEATPLLEAEDVRDHAGDELAWLYQSYGRAYAMLGAAGSRDNEAGPTGAVRKWFGKSSGQWAAIASRRGLTPLERAARREAERNAGSPESRLAAHDARDR